MCSQPPSSIEKNIDEMTEQEIFTEIAMLEKLLKLSLSKDQMSPKEQLCDLRNIRSNRITFPLPLRFPADQKIK